MLTFTKEKIAHAIMVIRKLCIIEFNDGLEIINIEFKETIIFKIQIEKPVECNPLA